MTERVTEEDMAYLEGLHAKTTPGVLFAAGGYLTVRNPERAPFQRSIYDLDELGQHNPRAPFQAVPFASAGDAEFFAAAKNDFPRFLATLRADRRRVDKATAEIERLRHALAITAGMLQCAIDPGRVYHRGDVVTLSHRGCVLGTFTFSQALDLANEVLEAGND